MSPSDYIYFHLLFSCGLFNLSREVTFPKTTQRKDVLLPLLLIIFLVFIIAAVVPCPPQDQGKKGEKKQKKKKKKTKRIFTSLLFFLVFF